jgi:Tfp pilus assembly protein FimT
MISVLALLAIPRFATGNSRRHMESARMRVAAALATARQAAIQKGETVVFKLQSNRVTVYTANATSMMLLSPVPLDTLYKVEADNMTVTFSGRGFATNLSLANNYITMRRTGVAEDTVTVTRTGMVKQ